MKSVIIVTGASSGLGAEFAKQLANRNADELWIIARREDKLKQVAQEINKISNITVKIITESIQGTTAYNRFKELFNEEIVIDTLVNNAGFGTYGPFEETPIQAQLDMIDLNVNALTAICGAALPYLKNGSRIINVASLAAFSPLGNFSVYAATKSYVYSFTLSLAAELKDKGIKVIAVCPGSVSTEFANVASNGARKEVLGGKPADKTVKHALKQLEKGKKVALMAFIWKAKAFLSRFIGHYFFARYSYIHDKRPYKHD